MALAEEAAAPEDAEDQLVEGDVDVGAEVAHLPRGAEALRLFEVVAVGLPVALQDLGGDGDLALLAGLAVVDADVALEIGLGLARVDDVEHERLELVVPEHVDAALEAHGVVEIGEEHREAAALVLGDEGLHRLAEVGRALGADAPEEAEDPKDPGLTAGR